MARHPSKTSATDTKRSEEGFLARWSRRKSKARGGERAPADAAPATAMAPAEAAKTESVQTKKTDADLPALESLDEHSDYRDFMSPKVSEGLRQAALKKLFHLSKFNVVDGLDDYAEDYTYFTPLGDIITADMRHRIELEKQKAEARLKELAQADDKADEKPAPIEDASSATQSAEEQQTRAESTRASEAGDDTAPDGKA